MENIKKKTILLNGVQDAQNFVGSASKCEFDIDIFYNRVVVDAKSLLGVLSLDLTKELTVAYQGDNKYFEETLNKYAVSAV